MCVVTPKIFERKIREVIPHILDDIAAYFSLDESLDSLQEVTSFERTYWDIYFRMSVKPETLDSVQPVPAGAPQLWIEDYPADHVQDTRTRSVYFDLFQDSLEFLMEKCYEHSGHYYVRNWNNWTYYENGLWLDWYGDTDCGCEEDEDF